MQCDFVESPPVIDKTQNPQALNEIIDEESLVKRIKEKQQSFLEK